MLAAVPALIAFALSAYFLLPWLVPLPPALAEARRHQPPARSLGPARTPQTAGGHTAETNAPPGDPQPQPARSLIDATLVAQDPGFWDHGGTDLERVLRALGDGVAHGRFISGGSTITEQLAKVSAARSSPRSVATRFADALVARRLEMSWSKEEILQEYLARLPFGNGHTGATAATAGYFGKSPADLTLAESAFLAGLPDAPARYDPYQHWDEAKKRQKLILDRMATAGLITLEEAREAANTPLTLR